MAAMEVMTWVTMVETCNEEEYEGGEEIWEEESVKNTYGRGWL